jgi:aspartyl protease family protein
MPLRSLALNRTEILMFGLDTDATMRLLYLALLLAFLAGTFGLRRRLLASSLGHLAIWAAIVVALVAVYAYREPLLRFADPVIGELMPSRAVRVNSEGVEQLVVRRGDDGHFHLDAEVNGASIRFLVDTGASSTVLTSRDAERAGIDTAELSFTSPVETANGRAFYARARLDNLAIGPLTLSDVPVAVMPAGGLNISLLGMSTIDRFAAWRIEGDRMVLVP